MFQTNAKKYGTLLIAIILLFVCSACSGVSEQSSELSADASSAISDTVTSFEEVIDSAAAITSSVEATTSSQGNSSDSAEQLVGSTADAWNLILVNLDHPLTEELDEHLIDLKVAKVAKGRRFDERAAQDLYAMFDAAKEAGHNLYSRSTYRTFQLQQTYYDAHVNNYMKQGMTRAEAEKKTEEYTARPKTSEHHTGLAIDITTDEWENAGKGLSTSFENTEACKWLKENAHKYGFILRYPKEKESITKIKYEPWHFRYVGEKHATKIYRQGICLEEYIASLA